MPSTMATMGMKQLTQVIVSGSNDSRPISMSRNEAPRGG